MTQAVPTPEQEQDQGQDEAYWRVADSIRIAASIEAVYDLVSDVTRTGEWSPECRSCEWTERSRDGHGVGARFLGHNDDGTRQWTTTSEVVVADRPERFEWAVLVDKIPGGAVRWAYAIEPADGGGTRLTEEWIFTREARDAYDVLWKGEGPAKRAMRRERALSGIPATLRRIKEVAEGTLPAA